MCNKIHEENRPIKETGFGWKIFRSWADDRGKIKSCFNNDVYDKTNGIIKWDPRFDYIGDGFCFFILKSEAMKALKSMEKGNFTDRRRYIRRITYSKGLVRQMESKMIIGTVEIALCKEWRFTSDQKRYRV